MKVTTRSRPRNDRGGPAPGIRCAGRLAQLCIVATCIGLATGTVRAQSTIALIDSGVAIFPPLQNVLVPGFNFYNGNGDTRDDSRNGHGTTVALVINQQAPGALIMPVKVTGPNFESSRGVVDAGINFAAANPSVFVINKSEGAQASRQVLAAAAAAGKIIVVPALNAAGPSPQGDALAVPQLGGRGIVAIGLDGAGGILVNSNRAGTLAQFALSAPGVNQFSAVFGSSFATAHISAAAARLKAAAPQLTAEQIVQLLFQTADDLGAAGVDSVYGHGRVNVERALSPQGDIGVGGGSSSSGGGSGPAVAAAALGIGGAIGYALMQRNKDDLAHTLVIDGYGRGYHVDLAQWVTFRDDSAHVKSVLDALEDEVIVDTLIDNGQAQLYGVVSRHIEENPQAMPAALDPFEAPVERVSMSFVGFNADGSRYSVGLNSLPRDSFGAAAAAQTAFGGISFLSDDTFSAPFFGFGDSGFGSQVGYRMRPDVELKFGMAQVDDNERFGLRSDSVLFEGTYERETFSLSAQFGYLEEDGSLFGGSSDGALSVDGASTWSLGLSGALQLVPGTYLLGNYTQGYTYVEDRSETLLQNFTDLGSNAFGLGVVSNDVFDRGDQFGIAFSQPLRVTSGSADLDVPYALDMEGNIYRNRKHIELEPKGTEHVYEIYYQYRKRGTSLGAHLLHRQNAYHEAGGGDDTALVTSLKFRF